MTSIVLGGGIGGLSTAYYLSKYANVMVSAFEASSRTGGWIQSTKSKNDSIFEIGPRTLRVVGEAAMNTLKLAEELDLQYSVKPVLRSQPAAKNRMLCVDGQLHSLPNKLSSFFKTVPPFSKPIATALLQDLRAPASGLEDDSIYNFVERRLGKEIADYAISSVICGTCAGDAKQISVNLLMSNYFKWEQDHGSITKGLIKQLFTKSGDYVKDMQTNALAFVATQERWSVWSLNGGLETLPARLTEVLNSSDNARVTVNSTCDSIRFSPTGVEVSINGEQKYAEHVYCALPSYRAADLLPKEHQTLKEELSAIPFVNVGVVNLEYEGNVLPSEGFGFLVPPNQNLPILGVIFDSCCFPKEGKTILTVMMGGHWFIERFGENPSEDHLADIAIKEVKAALKIADNPVDYKVSILKNCIPQYIVGHKARVERIRSYIAHHKLPLTLVGSSYDGIGINDVILSSRRAVESINSADGASVK